MAVLQAGQGTGLGTPVDQGVTQLETVGEAEVDGVAGDGHGDGADRRLRAAARGGDAGPEPVAAVERRRGVGHCRRTGGLAGVDGLGLSQVVLDRLIVGRLVGVVVIGLVLLVDISGQGAGAEVLVGRVVRGLTGNGGGACIGDACRKPHAMRVVGIDDGVIGAVLRQTRDREAERALISHRVACGQASRGDVEVEFVAVGPERIRREESAGRGDEARVEIERRRRRRALQRQRHDGRGRGIDRRHIGRAGGQATDAPAGHLAVGECLAVIGADIALELEHVGGFIDLGDDQRGRTVRQCGDVLRRRHPVGGGVDADVDDGRRDRRRSAEGTCEADLGV